MSKKKVVMLTLRFLEFYPCKYLAIIKSRRFIVKIYWLHKLDILSLTSMEPNDIMSPSELTTVCATDD